MREKTHADFRMLREGIGLSQADVADALDVTQRSVQRWEKPGEYGAPDFAWAWLYEMQDLFASMVEAGTASLDGAPDGAALQVAYYRSQREHDEHGRDDGYYGMVNAATREVVRIARDRGIEVTAMFPEEATGALESAQRETRR